VSRRATAFEGLLAAALLVVVALGCEPVRREQDAASGAPLASEQPAPAASAEPAPVVPPLSSGALIEDERNTIAVFRAVAPSVVFVTQKRTVVDFWGRAAAEVPAGAGSGFVWDDQGHIVTNFHVVEGAQALSVTLHDSKVFPAKVVGAEPRKDIAVLRIAAPKDLLRPIQIAPPKPPIEVGQKTIAIGNPFGLDHTLTTGVVSALGRQVEGIGGVTIRDMIQTDAAINPGNSGGPLLDSSGRLIGMNTMIFSRSGQSSGIGFAVPATTVARIVPQIVDKGHAEQVGIGIDIDPAGRIERQLGIRGVAILGVKPGSPADRAGLAGLQDRGGGLTLGDVITAIDGEVIPDYDSLYQALDGKKPGEKVKVTVQRDGRSLTTEVDLIVLEP
jgi:S1-C subfamily serine protease